MIPWEWSFKWTNPNTTASFYFRGKYLSDSQRQLGLNWCFRIADAQGRGLKGNWELSYLRGWRHRELAAACGYRTGEKKGRETKELFNLRYNLGKKANIWHRRQMYGGDRKVSHSWLVYYTSLSKAGKLPILSLNVTNSGSGSCHEAVGDSRAPHCSWASFQSQPHSLQDGPNLCIAILFSG